MTRFADWKKRSKQFNGLKGFERVIVETICQAAYKAGEREGRKQVKVIAQNGSKLSVLLEREACALIIDAKYKLMAARSYPPPAILRELAASIRMRSNAKQTPKGE